MSKPKTPELRTERLLLRALRDSDVESLWPAFSDSETMRYWSRGPTETMDELRSYLSQNIDCPTADCWVLTELTAQPSFALGYVVLVDGRSGCAELGYILRPDARGRGLAREAVAAAMGYGFGPRRLRRIWADVDPENQASIRLLEYQGFMREGLLRETWQTHLGIRDSVIYGRLASDPV